MTMDQMLHNQMWELQRFCQQYKHSLQVSLAERDRQLTVSLVKMLATHSVLHFKRISSRPNPKHKSRQYHQEHNQERLMARQLESAAGCKSLSRV